MTRPVIIGGGFAGLAAAVELAERGLRPLLLESRPHLGGRAYSFVDAESGETVDNGQHALMGCYEHTLAFLDRIGASRKLVRQPDLRVAMAHPRLGGGVIAAAPLPGPLHMLGGVLGYRLLRRRERLRVLSGGMALLRRSAADVAALTVSELLSRAGQSPHVQRCFWNPVAIATLNELPERAAAGPLLAVLRRAFFGSRAASQFVLPRVGLSELYVDDARAFIEARGGRVETHVTVAALDVDGDRIGALRLRDGRTIACDSCIAAVPPRALAAFAPPRLARPLADSGASPIVSVHLWLDRTVLKQEFLGLLGTTTQWVFNVSRLRGTNGGGQRLSAVISAAHALAGWDADQIAATVMQELAAVHPAARGATVLRSIVVKEKQATISNTPEVERQRPGATTAIDNFFLAGDWTATGLPPTIESAVLSGQRAAALAAALAAARTPQPSSNAAARS